MDFQQDDESDNKPERVNSGYTTVRRQKRRNNSSKRFFSNQPNVDTKALSEAFATAAGPITQGNFQRHDSLFKPKPAQVQTRDYDPTRVRASCNETVPLVCGFTACKQGKEGSTNEDDWLCFTQLDGMMERRGGFSSGTFKIHDTLRTKLKTEILSTGNTDPLYWGVFSLMNNKDTVVSGSEAEKLHSAMIVLSDHVFERHGFRFPVFDLTEAGQIDTWQALRWALGFNLGYACEMRVTTEVRSTDVVPIRSPHVDEFNRAKDELAKAKAAMAYLDSKDVDLASFGIAPKSWADAIDPTAEEQGLYIQAYYSVLAEEMKGEDLAHVRCYELYFTDVATHISKLVTNEVGTLSMMTIEGLVFNTRNNDEEGRLTNAFSKVNGQWSSAYIKTLCAFEFKAPHTKVVCGHTSYKDKALEAGYITPALLGLITDCLFYTMNEAVYKMVDYTLTLDYDNLTVKVVRGIKTFIALCCRLMSYNIMSYWVASTCSNYAGKYDGMSRGKAWLYHFVRMSSELKAGESMIHEAITFVEYRNVYYQDTQLPLPFEQMVLQLRMPQKVYDDYTRDCEFSRVPFIKMQPREEDPELMRRLQAIDSTYKLVWRDYLQEVIIAENFWGFGEGRLLSEGLNNTITRVLRPRTYKPRNAITWNADKSRETASVFSGNKILDDYIGFRLPTQPPNEQSGSCYSWAPFDYVEKTIEIVPYGGPGCILSNFHKCENREYTISDLVNHDAEIMIHMKDLQERFIPFKTFEHMYQVDKYLSGINKVRNPNVVTVQRALADINAILETERAYEAMKTARTVCGDISKTDSKAIINNIFKIRSKYDLKFRRALRVLKQKKAVPVEVSANDIFGIGVPPKQFVERCSQSPPDLRTSGHNLHGKLLYAFVKSMT